MGEKKTTDIVNFDMKFFNKRVVNQVHQHIKRIIYHDCV